MNRFYDKALQFIVLPDGNCGFLGEHALADGAPTARMCSEVPTAKTLKKKMRISRQACACGWLSHCKYVLRGAYCCVMPPEAVQAATGTRILQVWYCLFNRLCFERERKREREKEIEERQSGRDKEKDKK